MISPRCYYYDPSTDSWPQTEAAAIPHGGGTAYASRAQHDRWGLVMADGTSAAGYQKTVLYTEDGAKFGRLPDLPVAVERSCLALIDEDRMALVGGRPNNTVVSNTSYVVLQ